MGWRVAARVLLLSQARAEDQARQAEAKAEEERRVTISRLQMQLVPQHAALNGSTVARTAPFGRALQNPAIHWNQSSKIHIEPIIIIRKSALRLLLLLCMSPPARHENV